MAADILISSWSSITILPSFLVFTVVVIFLYDSPRVFAAWLVERYGMERISTLQKKGMRKGETPRGGFVSNKQTGKHKRKLLLRIYCLGVHSKSCELSYTTMGHTTCDFERDEKREKNYFCNRV